MLCPRDWVCPTRRRVALPTVHVMTTSGSPNTKKTEWHVALLGGHARQGPWQLPPRTVAISRVGGVDLDLTQATIPSEGVTIVKVSLVGGAKLKVPADVDVVVEGWNII